jgi:hypothetical protein
MSLPDNAWEIVQLLHAIAHAIDEPDFDRYAELLAHCTFTTPGGRRMQGRQQVAQQGRESLRL